MTCKTCCDNRDAKEWLVQNRTQSLTNWANRRDTRSDYWICICRQQTRRAIVLHAWRRSHVKSVLWISDKRRFDRAKLVAYGIRSLSATQTTPLELGHCDKSWHRQTSTRIIAKMKNFKNTIIFSCLCAFWNKFTVVFESIN